ncbi:hypothetical protein CGRA01v4_06759 [Colletotrichum graminicola]|uniref:Uncharacterized protein n=1 Tax=Colletotrichum graminicola (strain M1.001 / M2 / FGSC 10212) TaxID=645133 RepID=E3Q2Y8_COLGM|nr:uncharacterized protein GLRG_00111 [Colletotrichum graminicola M1.001]EFQ24967.1 hypothetical protein GLRG_00111 [Colletotrichum graminicola M1.001]WDK15478.1 hypothetical protein CGRA01v4_06759 [Colletotrichum graminicola]
MGNLFLVCGEHPVFFCGHHFSTAEIVSGRHFTRYIDRSIRLHRQRASTGGPLTSFSLLRFTLYTCFPDDFTTPPLCDLDIASIGVWRLPPHPAYDTLPSVQRTYDTPVRGTGIAKQRHRDGIHIFISWVDSVGSP